MIWHGDARTVLLIMKIGPFMAELAAEKAERPDLVEEFFDYLCMCNSTSSSFEPETQRYVEHMPWLVDWLRKNTRIAV